MFLEWFGLHQDPFSGTARPRHLFPSASYRQALGELYYHLECGPRILTLTADSGMGKTTLLRQIENRLRVHFRTVYLSSSCCHLEELLRGLAFRGEISGGLRNGREGQQHVTNGGVPDAQSRQLVLLIDDAHELGDEAAQAMRLLIRSRRGPVPARIVLAGSPDMPKRLFDSDLRDNLHQIFIAPLAPAEVEGYILHRLRLAGCGDPIFDPEACAAIAIQSRGASAKINDLCSAALRTAAERGLKPINRSVIVQDFSEAGASAALSAPAHSRANRTAPIAAASAILCLVIAGIWYGSKKAAAPIASVAAKPQSPQQSANDLSIEAPLHIPSANNPPRESASPKIRANEMTLSPATENRASSGGAPSIALRTSMPAVVPHFNSVSTRAAANRPVNPQAAAISPQRAKALVTPRSATTAAAARAASPSTIKNATATAKIAPVPVVGAVSAKPASASVTAPVTAGVAKTIAPPIAARGAETRAMVAAAAPSHPSALAVEQAAFETRLGDAYMRLGEYDNAIRSFQSALILAPDNGEVEQRIDRARSAKATEQSTLR